MSNFSENSKYFWLHFLWTLDRIEEDLLSLCEEKEELVVASEEIHELGADIMRVLRGRKTKDQLIEEAVDVFVMMMHLRHICGADQFDKMLKMKLDRLDEKLENK